MEEKRVRCMFTGNRRYDASARQTPDRPDDPIQRKAADVVCVVMGEADGINRLKGPAFFLDGNLGSRLYFTR